MSSVVVGGGSNQATGTFSFAAGRYAQANHSGAFVWADTSNFLFASTAVNQFNARATGGARFVSAVDGAGVPTAGVTLAAGGGSWGTLSDRSSKRNITAISGRAILAALSSIPIQEWSYKSQDEAIRHIGPMAQDFADAFGVGEDDRHINTVDADGVALAAIQGLHEELLIRDNRIEAQTAVLRKQEDRLVEQDNLIEQQQKQLTAHEKQLQQQQAILQELKDKVDQLAKSQD